MGNEEIYRSLCNCYKKLQVPCKAVINKVEDGKVTKSIKRTALFVEIIAKKARELGYYQDEITDEFIENLKKAMPLHDIGKIVVPDDILKAPRKLTKEEYEIMKTARISILSFSKRL